MNRSIWRWIAAAALGTLLALPASLAEPRERSGRSSSRGTVARSGGVGRTAVRTAPTGARSRSSARISGQSARSSNRTEVRGTPNYGYRGRRGSYGWYGSYGGFYYPYYYGPYGYWYGYWGYPYWGGYWYGPPHYVRVVERGTESRVAVVETDVRPKKADVWVDGEFRGQARDFNGTWDLLYLEPGRRTIELRRDGYKTLRLDLQAHAGLHLRIDDRLEKGAGVVERTLDLPPPERTDETTATAEAPGEEPRFEVAPPERPSLREGLLHIAASPPDAAVYLDGEFLASAAELSRLHGALPVAIGRHTIEVVRPGYRGVRREIEVGEDQPASIEVSLEREDGGG